MKSNCLALLFTLLISIVSCQNDSENKFDKIEKLNWLVGNWEQKLPDGIVTEIWNRENDSTYLGKSFFVKEEDTIHLETIVLTQKKGNLLYIPTVNGQNNNEPVTFTLSLDEENTVTFENPAHDYPQKISYKKINDNSLMTTISGKQQGKQSKESYTMVKK